MRTIQPIGAHGAPYACSEAEAKQQAKRKEKLQQELKKLISDSDAVLKQAEL